MVNNYKMILVGSFSCILLFSLMSNPVFASETMDVQELYKKANEHLLIGELHEAIEICDEILEIYPENVNTLIMKGVALSNLERHKQSLTEFYKALEFDPKNILALTGMGVGFGNLGEYKEAQLYFENADEVKPNNHVITNYKDFAQKTVEKYPYNEVDKPEIFEIDVVEVIPTWVKNTAGWWAANEIQDKEFLSGIHFLITNGFLVIDIPDISQMSEESKKNSERNLWEFSRYLDRIEKTVINDKRYIEYPNPSSDVIKKFLRDYVKWNFDQQIEIGNKDFPNPEYVLVDDTYHLEYKIYINDQPIGLPLDHVSTLINSFKYWEDVELSANDGKPVKIHFVTTKSRIDANLWVTWVVRDIGENVLGHANLGKGVIEVALGGYGCDGNFQLFHVDTVETIMTHELGHGIGLKHSKDPDSIMYPTIKKVKYAYCLLDVNQ